MDPTWLVQTWDAARRLMGEPVAGLALFGLLAGAIINLPGVFVARLRHIGRWHADAHRRLRPRLRTLKTLYAHDEDARMAASGALLREHGVNPLWRPTAGVVALSFALVRGLAMALFFGWIGIILSRMDALAWQSPDLHFGLGFVIQDAWWLALPCAAWLAGLTWLEQEELTRSSTFKAKLQAVFLALVKLAVCGLVPVGLLVFAGAWSLARVAIVLTSRDLRRPVLPELPSAAGPLPG